LTVPKNPASVLDPSRRSSRAPGSTTPQVKRPKAWATQVDAITTAMASHTRSLRVVSVGAVVVTRRHYEDVRSADVIGDLRLRRSKRSEQIDALIHMPFVIASEAEDQVLSTGICEFLDPSHQPVGGARIGCL
jgi:hypothetical protein